MPYATLTGLPTTALLRLAAAVVLYLLLHLVRLPLLLAAAVLAISMHRMAACAAHLTGSESAPAVRGACPHHTQGGDRCDAP